MTEVGSRGDHKRNRPRRKKKTKKGSYTADELIKLWGTKLSQVKAKINFQKLKKLQDCPNLDTIVLKMHEVHEKGDLTKVKVIFPIQKNPELPPEVSKELSE